MDKRLKKLCYTAMFAVLCYVTFAYGKINIALVGGSSTAIHVANAVVVLAAWFLGPIYGGLAGAIGLSIADVFDPLYITSAPKTFILKFLIGFISGKVAEKLKLAEKEDRKSIIKTASLSAIAGLGFNVIFDPIFGYIYKRFLLNVDASTASIIATWSAGVTAFNAVLCTIIAVLLYLSLHKVFRKLMA